eukprot:7722361-Pyramimonas_sp.AAC.1
MGLLPPTVFGNIGATIHASRNGQKPIFSLAFQNVPNTARPASDKPMPCAPPLPSPGEGHLDLASTPSALQS